MLHLRVVAASRLATEECRSGFRGRGKGVNSPGQSRFPRHGGGWTYTRNMWVPRDSNEEAIAPTHAMKTVILNRVRQDVWIPTWPSELSRKVRTVRGTKRTTELQTSLLLRFVKGKRGDTRNNTGTTGACRAATPFDGGSSPIGTRSIISNVRHGATQTPQNFPSIIPSP